MARPNPSDDSREPSPQSCTSRGEQSMGLSTHTQTRPAPLVIAYENHSRRLKDKLYLERAVWLRTTGKSCEEFAARLSAISGREITAKMIEHWLNPNDHARQIHGAMLPFWRAAVQDDLHSGERIVAEALIEAQEFEVYERGE